MEVISKEILRESFSGFFENQTAYDFQIRVAQHLLAGKSVILQAPTGAGKTNTALFPFLYARQHLTAQEFPRKMIYSVPMRILANNFVAEALEVTKGMDMKVSIQTGERPEDPKFQSGMIFTTIDQTLSSFLNVPYSLNFGSYNFNAGAIASSYLVFDEAHLFDGQRALPTVIHMLGMLKGCVPFLLMTATFSEELLEKLAIETKAKVFRVEKDKLQEMESQQKERKFIAVEEEISAEAVWETHKHHWKHSIVICNTVGKAQKVFAKLIELSNGSNTKITLLHSRFWKHDRATKEKSLISIFGKKARKAKKTSHILVATQVIEVGVDISCETLHTQLAPANSILQRAGRCARYKDETGKVYVYYTEDTLPYDNKSFFDDTFKGIKELQGVHVDFLKECWLIKQVHTKSDLEMLQAIKNNPEHKKMMLETMEQCKREHLNKLIRDDSSRVLLIHHNPDEIDDPYNFEGISLHEDTHRSLLSGLRELAEKKGLTWGIKYPVTKNKEEDEAEFERKKIEWKWDKLEKGQERGKVIVAVNPELVSYNPQEGFIAEPGIVTKESEKIRETKNLLKTYSYQLESYKDHIENLYKVYVSNGYKDEIAYVAHQIQVKMGDKFPINALDYGTRLAIALHDAGKLGEGWQNYVQNWQKEVRNPVANNFLAAHTDYNPDKDKPLARQFKASGIIRPNHAVESARIAQVLLKTACGEKALLYRPIATAIARHHSPLAINYNNYKLHKEASTTISEALEVIKDRQFWKIDNSLLLQDSFSGKMEALNNDNTFEWILYFLIVRTLRLADQNSFSVGEEE